jgi:hypothetical protein
MSDTKQYPDWLVIDAGMRIAADPLSRGWKGYIPREVAEKICGRKIEGVMQLKRREVEPMRAQPEWIEVTS